VIGATPILIGRAYLLFVESEEAEAMKALTSEYRREAARLRALIAEATTARAKQHLEEQARLNERLATGRSNATSIARRVELDRAA
jgi:hypothetical protein